MKLTVSGSGPRYQLRGNVLLLVLLARVVVHGPVAGSLAGPAFLVLGHAAAMIATSRRLSHAQR